MKLIKYHMMKNHEKIIQAQISFLAVAGYTNLESLCEDIMQSLRSHFIAAGYMEILG